MSPNSDSSARVAATCALRKVAVLCHWVPGVGVQVIQERRDPLCVAAFDVEVQRRSTLMSPCGFRRALVASLTERSGSIAGLIDLDEPLTVSAFTDPTTTLTDAGIVLHRLDEVRAAMAFPTLVGPDSCVEMRDECLGMCTTRLDFERDAELGVTLAHTTVDYRDDDDVEQARCALVDMVVRLGVVESLDQLAGPEPE